MEKLVLLMKYSMVVYVVLYLIILYSILSLYNSFQIYVIDNYSQCI